MLKIIVPDCEEFNELTQEFIYTKGSEITLEHSLVSISKWETKWHKPFLSKEKKTQEEMKDYVKCMTLTQNVNPNVYDILTKENYLEINNYIEDPMTATRVNNRQEGKGRVNKIITSEVIYSWMINLNIPFECQKWHLNRLLMLIQVCSESNNADGKMKKKDIYAQNRALNAARRNKYHTKG